MSISTPRTVTLVLVTSFEACSGMPKMHVMRCVAGLPGYLQHSHQSRSHRPVKSWESPGDGTTLYIISIVMVIISGSVAIARMAVVLTKTKVELDLDDYCICLAPASVLDNQTDGFMS
ncbi:hypothetical protein F5884DRAFT_749841 [Xylogone sp. PMI_703]|nr:hypothetical protein F5884DRAFT_749841 [Xylogone sp. PMI_703]